MSRAIADFLAMPVRQTATIRQRDHRPWPVPRKPWLMAQSWLDLLFAHWPLAPEDLRPRVPKQLSLDTFDDVAWIAVTPFVVSGLRLALTPPLPYVSRFPEINVRTYVTLENKPGIFFFSLDADSRFAVSSARRVYKLPYFVAGMSASRSGSRIDYTSRRDDARAQEARFQGSYSATGPAEKAKPGSLEYFLTERYCLYTLNKHGEALRAEIHHPPWPLQPAKADIAINTMTPPGIELPKEEPLLHFAARQDVLIWRPTKIT
jgi:uncharacterized protein